MFRRFGVIRVDDPEEMLAIAAAASAGIRPQGRRVAIVTTSGGAGGWAADICEQAGLEVPPLGSDMLFEQIPAYLEFFGLPSTTPEQLRAVAQLG